MLISATIPIKNRQQANSGRILDMEKINFRRKYRGRQVLAVFAASADNYKVIIEVCLEQNNAYTNRVYTIRTDLRYIHQKQILRIGEYWFEIGNDTYIVELTNK